MPPAGRPLFSHRFVLLEYFRNRPPLDQPPTSNAFWSNQSPEPPADLLTAFTPLRELSKSALSPKVPGGYQPFVPSPASTPPSLTSVSLTSSRPPPLTPPAVKNKALPEGPLRRAPSDSLTALC